MKNLLNFFLKYNYWFLFVLLEIISFALLFRFNSYQGSAFFTSANFVSGAMYDAANNVTGYFHLKTINDELVQKNVELELQLESIRKALIEATEDSSGVEQLKQEALAGYDIFKASVINNSVTHADNYITLDKGEADGIRGEMGVVNGSGVVGIVYLTSPHYSIVIPVLNSKSSISCKIKRSDYFGFLKWDGGSSEFAFIKDMPRHSLFSLGDTIVTSGHSAVFPSGIPVGTVLNHMHINGYATPFFFIYFILKYNSGVSRNVLMIWAFLLGLTVDILGNTPGMNAAAATVLAFMREPVLRLVTLRDSVEDFEPGIKRMGFSPFFRYILLCTFLFCTILLVIDTFSFFNLPVLLLKILTDASITVICILCAEAIRRKK